ncbi:hypothetical protein B0T18DRAFT_461872 [Schizothecium vesticola]|uniref:SET domain-containing protein n=1 Tax=Schizothecium vesticola TaxID=314040 RepID=A0AA40F2E8_9PEZI|nr:hypothetical protein B0T18DRAFT_461872 [Schizothecium vesticola]
MATLLLLLALTMTPSSTAFTTSPSTCTWTPHGSPYPLHALSSGVCPLESPPSHTTPWSHPPLCPPPANPSVGGELADPCLYTYATFRGNSGLSLITSPDIAASIAPALDDTAVPTPFRGFTVVPLPRRGLGVLATRPLPKGELVMVAAPVLLVRADFLTTTTTGGASETGGRYSVRQQEAVLERAMRQLPGETQRRVVGLARRGEGHGSFGELVRDVLGTNAFHLDVEGVDHLALYLEPSRMNHGCRPNVFWRFSWKHMTMEVVALRDIQPGEEIVYSYTFLGYTRQERLAMLSHWGFTCSCAMCTAGPSEIALSDRRRDRLFELHATLSAAAEAPESLPRERIDALVAETRKLIEEEQLDPQLVEYYQVFARVYLALGDGRRVREYIRAAEEKWVLYEGEEHSNIEGIRGLWEEVEGLGEDEEDEEEW